jgi:hypothetical protein
MSLTGYLNDANIDLINVFESITTPDTTVNSGSSGIQITVLSGCTGPLEFQTNGSGSASQNINLKTSTGGGINISPNNTTAFSLSGTGMIMSPNGTTCLTTNTSGNIKCFNQWRYGIRVIANTVASQIYTILLTDPRNIFFTGTIACSLIFPPTPPNGTEYFIRKTSASQYNITVTTNATLSSGNSLQSTFGTTTMNSGVVYSTLAVKWICFNIAN